MKKAALLERFLACGAFNDWNIKIVILSAKGEEKFYKLFGFSGQRWLSDCRALKKVL